MNNANSKCKINEIVLSAGIAMLSLLFVFAIDGFFPFGQGSIVALDLNSQYVPLLYRFYDVVTGTKNIAIDFHLGGGINLYSDTLTEILNPFNYLLLLFERANIYKTVNVLLVLYVMAATTTANYTLSKLFPNTNKYLRVALSLSYGMSYFCAYQYEIIRWMYIVVLFPLLFLALKRMLENEAPLIFICLLAYILMLSLQFGMQLCIFSFVYSACYLLVNKKAKNVEATSEVATDDKENRKVSGRKCLITGLSLITAILLSAPSTVPAVMNIMSSARGAQNNSILTVITHHGLNNILERILEISNPVALGIIIATVFVCKKATVKLGDDASGKNRVLIWCLVILVITAVLEPSNLLWHLGSYQCFPVRYGYAVVLLMAIIACALNEKVFIPANSEYEDRNTKAVKADDIKAEDIKAEDIKADEVKGDNSEINSLGKSKTDNHLWINILSIVSIILVSAAILLFVYSKRLMFAQAFATLDISGVCKKETILLYIIAAIIVIASAGLKLFADCLKKNTVSQALVIYVSALMGIVWFMAVLWPQSSEARAINETNYVVMNNDYSINSANNADVESKESVYNGHTREAENFPLNAALVDGSYSMTAYVPSGEGLEYVNAMQKLGYETPWISVTQNGGSTQSDRLLGLDGDFFGAILVSQDEYEQLKNIADCDKLLASKMPQRIVFDHRKGKVRLGNVGVGAQESEKSKVNVEDGVTGSFGSAMNKCGENIMYVLLPMAYIKGWSCEQGNITNYLGGFLAVEIDNSTAETNNSVNEIELDYSVPGLGVGFIAFVVGLILMIVLLLVSEPNAQRILVVRKKSEQSFGAETSANLEDSENLLTEQIHEIFWDKLARIVYLIVLVIFITVVYVLPNLGLMVYMGAKAAGKDIAPYLESTKAKNEPVHTLLSQTMEEDGLHVLVGLDNLMTHKNTKITTSDNESADFRGSKVADGVISHDSRWSSVNNWDDNEHYIQADFKNSQCIKAINIYWDRTNASHYYIEVSDDGQQWVVASEFDEPAKSNPQTIYYENGIQGRFVRLHVTEVTKNEEDISLYYQNVTINEIEVYGDTCDSFVIDTPTLINGISREIPVPEVPQGYLLKFGGIDYDNLVVDGDKFADTIDSVDIELGYKLYCNDESWDLDGFKLTLPASGEERKETFPFNGIEVCEWIASEGELEIANYETLANAIKDRENEDSLEIICDEAQSGYSENENNYLGDEGYEIVISKDGIKLLANTNKGIYQGRVTLSHMLSVNNRSWPCGTIRDYPKYPVRGFVLDVARRPITMEFLYKVLDTLADNHMNTLQLHLSDNAIITSSDYDGTVEGARELFSAFRLESQISAGDEKLTSEFHYTDEEFTKFVADAKKMGIDVVPEIDTPAHSMAFTKLFPELGFDNDPHLADSLDVTKLETLEFVKKLWGEYLQGSQFADVASNQSAPLFDNCEAINIGMDEYYGDSDAFTKYIASVTKAVKGMAADKIIRMWACTEYCGVDLAQIDKNTQIMFWSSFWDKPERLYDAGFSIINCLSDNLYMIAGNGEEKSEGLNIESLKKDWEPNRFYGADIREEFPAWSAQMLGACYSLWNDQYSLTGEGPDDEELFELIDKPAKVLADKLW